MHPKLVHSLLLSLLLLKPPKRTHALPLPSLPHVPRLDISDILAPINLAYPDSGSLPHVAVPNIAPAEQDFDRGITDFVRKLKASTSLTHNQQLLTTHEIGPLALLETFQTTFLRILELGFWRGVLGSILVFWAVVGLALGTVFGVGVYLRRREQRPYERGFEFGAGRTRPSRRMFRTVLEGRREVGGRGLLWREGRRVSSGKRVRWADEVVETDMDECGLGGTVASGGGAERGLCSMCEVSGAGAAECDLLGKLD